MASKTDVTARKDAKRKEKFYVIGEQGGLIPVVPVRRNGRMVWMSENGEYWTKWTVKK